MGPGTKENISLWHAEQGTWEIRTDHSSQELQKNMTILGSAGSWQRLVKLKATSRKPSELVSAGRISDFYR